MRGVCEVAGLKELLLFINFLFSFISSFSFCQQKQAQERVRGVCEVAGLKELLHSLLDSGLILGCQVAVTQVRNRALIEP